MRIVTTTNGLERYEFNIHFMLFCITRRLEYEGHSFTVPETIAQIFDRIIDSIEDKTSDNDNDNSVVKISSDGNIISGKDISSYIDNGENLYKYLIVTAYRANLLDNGIEESI